MIPSFRQTLQEAICDHKKYAMTSLKPLHILYLNAVPFVGGAEISLLQMLMHLNPGEFTAEIACSKEGTLSKLLNQNKIPVHFLNLGGVNFQRKQALISISLSLSLFIKKHGFHILHINSFPLLYAGVLAGKMANVPVVLHVRDLLPEKNPWHRKLSLKKVNQVIAISHAVARTVKPLSNKVKVIYNGVDINMFLPGVNPVSFLKKTGASGKNLVGVVGYLIERKGIESFLEAVKTVALKNVDVMFLIVGEDPKPGKPYENKLRKLAQKLGISEKVVFTGYEPSPQEVFAALDILVMPSYEEPFGRVLIEAGACGKPCVATDAGGAPEVIQDGYNGFLVPPGNPEALANAMDSLLKNPNLARTLGENGRKHVEEKFTIQRTAREVQDVYSQLCKK